MNRLKPCSLCDAEFPATPEFFHRDKNTSDGLYPWCKPCRKDKASKHYLANRERILAKNAEWKRANPDKVAEQPKAWGKAHPERRAEAWRRYAERHPERIRAKLHKRRTIMTAGAGIFAQDIKDRYAAQRGLCQWCSEVLNNNYHMDHWIPLSRGGEHGPHNLVLACATCNLTKFNRLPFTEWVPPNPLGLF